MLVGKYIPNLVTKKFDVFREYAQLIYDQTSSPLKKWDRDNPFPTSLLPSLLHLCKLRQLPSQPSGPAMSVDDVPIKANDILNVIVAQKLKKVEEVPLSKSIKDLVGGKSTLQNEILGDLQMEFTSAPEKGEELPLEELDAALGVGLLVNILRVRCRA
jgi:hypothetical protein